MLFQEIKEAITKKEKEIECLKTNRNHFIARKRELEAQLGNRNQRNKSGVRMSLAEYNDWKQKKVREWNDIEALLANLKQTISLKENERMALKSQLKEIREVKDIEEGFDHINAIHDLRGQITELQKENLRLSRQLDAAIRELNAIPKSVRILS